MAAALADQHRRRGTRPLRAWCVGAGGCAEPASVVMLAHAAGIDVDVIATDIGKDAIDDVHRGLVDGTSIALPRAVVGNRAIVDGDGWRVSAEVRGAIRGAVGALDDVPAGGPFDIIVCRDVLHHYRSEVAVTGLRRLARSCAAGGVIVLSAVDALVCGLPIDGLQVSVRVGTDGLEALSNAAAELIVDDDAHAALKLAALFDAHVEIPERSRHLLTLAGRGSWLEEARLGAAALAIADKATADADALLAPLGDGVFDVVHDDFRLLKALNLMLQGRHGDAVELLQQVQHPSWLAPYLLAQLWRRTHREALAFAQFRLVERRLDGSGDAPPWAPLVSMCDVREARGVTATTLRERAQTWHGP